MQKHEICISTPANPQILYSIEHKGVSRPFSKKKKKRKTSLYIYIRYFAFEQEFTAKIGYNFVCQSPLQYRIVFFIDLEHIIENVLYKWQNYLISLGDWHPLGGGGGLQRLEMNSTYIRVFYDAKGRLLAHKKKKSKLIFRGGGYPQP